MPPLIPCPACARHVRSQEPACPFCEAPLPRARSVSPGLAAAAGLALLATGCPSERGDQPAPVYGAPDPAPVVSDSEPAPIDRDDIRAEYGAPMPPPDVEPEPRPDDRDQIRPKYGAPPPPPDEVPRPGK